MKFKYVKVYWEANEKTQTHRLLAGYIPLATVKKDTVCGYNSRLETTGKNGTFHSLDGAKDWAETNLELIEIKF